jgi:DNA (cytosine-5)-methyltransferase 1
MKLNTFFDLCSGIGGGRLGLELAGMKSVGFSDTSRLSATTYKLMFDTADERNYGNLKKIKCESLPEYDVLIAGFPCQTFSVIGRREGFEDIRGQIIFHIARILHETQPKAFILENVKGLVTHDNGKTLQTILGLLNDAGYEVVYKVLTSLDYGVPQMRQRVYFVGINKNLKTDINEFKWPEPVAVPPLTDYLVEERPIPEWMEDYLPVYLQNIANNGKYSKTDLLQMEGKVLDTRMSDLRIYDGKVPTLRSQRDGILYVKNHRICSLTGYEAMLLQGFPAHYAMKVKDVVSDRHLLMQAGNAMTVNVIHMIGDSLQNHVNTLPNTNI